MAKSPTIPASPPGWAPQVPAPATVSHGTWLGCRRMWWWSSWVHTSGLGHTEGSGCPESSQESLGWMQTGQGLTGNWVPRATAAATEQGAVTLGPISLASLGPHPLYIACGEKFGFDSHFRARSAGSGSEAGTARQWSCSTADNQEAWSRKSWRRHPLPRPPPVTYFLPRPHLQQHSQL